MSTLLFQANPAVFAPAWNHSHTSIPLVPTEPSCGCGHILNSDMVEGNIALIERGECSFVSKVTSKSMKTLTSDQSLEPFLLTLTDYQRPSI